MVSLALVPSIWIEVSPSIILKLFDSKKTSVITSVVDSVTSLNSKTSVKSNKSASGKLNIESAINWLKGRISAEEKLANTDVKSSAFAITSVETVSAESRVTTSVKSYEIPEALKFNLIASK